MNPPSHHIALKTESLSIGYNRKNKVSFLVQENLNLKIESGELICLMGSNGAGKSTLLRTLAGLQAPLSGEVIVGGQRLHSLSQAERAQHISLVLTEAVSAGNMTVQELVALGRYPHTSWGGALGQKDRQVVEQAMEELEVAELAGRSLYELSDGQRQKALIARALAQDGALMILDEPTAHLDLINRLHIMQLLRQLAVRRKKAIIIATHELDLALQFADRLWLLQNKKGGLSEGIPEDLVLNGSLEKVFSRPGYHFDVISGQFLAEIPAGVPIQLKGEEPSLLWTRKALQRKGYEARQGNGKIQIEVKRGKEGIFWLLTSGEITKTACSIEELLKELKKL